MKKIILILVGLALCLTVAAQEKAKTTNVQGYALAIDNAFSLLSTKNGRG